MFHFQNGSPAIRSRVQKSNLSMASTICMALDRYMTRQLSEREKFLWESWVALQRKMDSFLLAKTNCDRRPPEVMLENKYFLLNTVMLNGSSLVSIKTVPYKGSKIVFLNCGNSLLPWFIAEPPIKAS